MWFLTDKLIQVLKFILLPDELTIDEGKQRTKLFSEDR